MSLPSAAKGVTSVQPTTLPTSVQDRLPSLEANGDDNGALTSNQPATQSPIGAPVSGDVVNSARVERNPNVSALRVVPQSSQKVSDDTPITPSPDLISQGRNLRSISPQVGVTIVSQSQSVHTPQVKTPVQASASVPLVSTSSGQNEPKPPRRRQSSGLDFLQLDLQVARQKKLAKLAPGTQKSGTTQASPGGVPSPTTKDGPVTTVSLTPTTTAGIPDTPGVLISTPTVPATAQATLAQTPSSTQAPISAITNSVSNTTSQPQMVQTPSPTLVHRDLRQGSSRIRTASASPRKLRISDRAPAPAPEPGSSSAPIVIDERDVSMSTPAVEPIDVDVVDVIMQLLTQTKETPMVLDSDPQNVQGNNGDAKDDRKPQHDQEGKGLPEQQALLHDKKLGAQLEQTNDRQKPPEHAMEGLGTPSLGNEPSVLSNHSAVGVISAPDGKDMEMIPPAPTATISTAIAAESSAIPDHSIISAQSVVVGSSSSGTATLPVVEPPLPMGQEASWAPSIFSGKARAPHPRIGSLSDMDISCTSDTPPIVVLGARASHSRSTSPQSGKRSSEGGSELVRAEEIEEDASEMVDELAPLFGKEMKVICMDRAYDVPGEFTWDITLSPADWDRVSQWAKAPDNLEYVSRPSFFSSIQAILNFVLPSSFDISQARCITLACYLMQDLDPYATQDGLLRDQWFENVKPVPWANLPRNLWALINDEVTAMFPPYSVQSSLFARGGLDAELTDWVFLVP